MKYEDIKEGDILETPRFTICESLSYKWITVCRDCVEIIMSKNNDLQKQTLSRIRPGPRATR